MGVRFNVLTQREVDNDDSTVVILLAEAEIQTPKSLFFMCILQTSFNITKSVIVDFHSIMISGMYKSFQEL